MQVKIFRAKGDDRAIEDNINRWLNEQSSINVHHVCQSQVVDPAANASSDNTHQREIIISVWYD